MDSAVFCCKTLQKNFNHEDNLYSLCAPHPNITVFGIRWYSIPTFDFKLLGFYRVTLYNSTVYETVLSFTIFL